MVQATVLLNGVPVTTWDFGRGVFTTRQALAAVHFFLSIMNVDPCIYSTDISASFHESTFGLFQSYPIQIIIASAF